VAKAAVVKNWWWEANKDRYAGLTAYEIPKFSYLGNPDNVLTASNAVPKASQEKIIVAAMKNSKVFNAQSVSLFDANTLKFSLWLMKQGKIDPMTYNWLFSSRNAGPVRISVPHQPLVPSRLPEPAAIQLD
jgi:hypothetical protein